LIDTSERGEGDLTKSEQVRGVLTSDRERERNERESVRVINEGGREGDKE
jgi:hypothetical protein